MDRIGMSVDFNDEEAKVIAYLVEHFDKDDHHVNTGEISAGTQLPLETIKAILERFARDQMVSRVTRGDLWSIEPQLLNVADQLRAPSPDERDYPKEIERWFRSKWWSVPVCVLLVVLPALVGYITMIRTLLEWLSVIKK